MAHPNTRERAPERRKGHSRPLGRLQMPHRGIDDAKVAPTDEATAETIDLSNPLCQFDPTCGWLTRAQDVEKAMRGHYGREHSGAAV